MLRWPDFMGLPILIGTPSKDALESENIKGCKYFHLQASYGASFSIYTTEVLLCFKFELARVQPCWSTLYQWREQRKRKGKKKLLITYVIYTYVTHSTSIMTSHTPTGDTQTYNICSRVLAIFKRRVLTN